MALTTVKPIVGIHKNDPQWIIALWRAIHWGDPAPEIIPVAEVNRAAAEAIKALSAYLPAAQAKAVTTALSH